MQSVLSFLDGGLTRCITIRVGSQNGQPLFVLEKLSDRILSDQTTKIIAVSYTEVQEKRTLGLRLRRRRDFLESRIIREPRHPGIGRLYPLLQLLRVAKAAVTSSMELEHAEC